MEKKDFVYKREPISDVRKVYFGRLAFRIVVFVIMVVLYFAKSSCFDVVGGGFFTDGFSLLHIIWAIWVFDMLWQLIPVKNHISLGSQKVFKQRFKPIREKINYEALKSYIVMTTKSAYKVFLIWVVLIAVIGVLYYQEILSETHLFLISTAFYVCDLICVLIWCPFRLIMKNRCCTTCRIFNWDHLMMFTPMLFVNSFYARSLLVMAVVIWGVWELCVMIYPERFWEHSNAALRCSECTDKLCTQYCRKLRKTKYR